MLEYITYKNYELSDQSNSFYFHSSFVQFEYNGTQLRVSVLAEGDIAR